mgnify:CR=1 FL=1
MDTLSNDAVAKIVEFLGKDGQPFSKTSKRNWQVTQKARYQMLTHGYWNAEHPEWGKYEGSNYFYSKKAALAAMEKKTEDKDVVWIGIYQHLAPIGYVANQPTFFREWYYGDPTPASTPCSEE